MSTNRERGDLTEENKRLLADIARAASGEKLRCVNCRTICDGCLNGGVHCRDCCGCEACSDDDVAASFWTRGFRAIFGRE